MVIDPLALRVRARDIASDAVDQVPDVDVEQRVGLGGVDAARVAARSDSPPAGAAARAPHSTATNPTVAHMSSRHACTAASAREAVASHRVDERPRRLHVCVASRARG